MSESNRHALAWHLEQPYPYLVMPDPEGGYIVRFPDLPGCLTQVETADEIAPMADEIRALWIETAFDEGIEIPPPAGPVEYSGKFLVRVPRSLHRTLAESAEREGASLNAYVTMVLSRGDAQARIERRFADLERMVTTMQERLTYETPVTRSRPRPEIKLAFMNPVAA